MNTDLLPDTIFRSELSAFYDGLDTGILIVDQKLSVFFLNDWICNHLPEGRERIFHLEDLYDGHDISFVRYIVGKTINYKAPHILSQAFHSWIIPLPDRRFPDGLMRQGVRIIPFSGKNISAENPDCSFVLIQIKDNSETVLRIQGMKLSQQKLSEKKDELEHSNLQLHKEISERIQAEKALRENLNFLQRLIDTIPSPVFYKDAGGYYQGCNKAFERFTGFRCEDTIGKNVFEIYPEKLARIFAESDRELLKQEGIYIFENEFPDQEGNERDVFFYKAAYEDINGKYGGIVGMMVDITEHKKTEKELREARDKAESASKAKSEFLAKMSHELRTPLNSIMGFAQLLRMNTNLSDKQKDRLGIIEKSGQHLLDIINNLLDLSKIEAGHSELQPETFRLSDFLRQISEIAHTQIRNKNIRFHENFEPHLPDFIYADETKLRQIIFNIIGNAIKFTHGGAVSFSVKNSPQGIRFQIDDTGIGIESENIDKIFIPFHQIHDRYRFVEGTGLGLAISHSFLQLMGSQLQVSSIPKKGSSFSFILPVPDYAPNPVLKSYSGPEKRKVQRKKYNILIADDIPLNRLVLKEILEQMDICVLEAENGRECAEKAKEFRPDLILMDIKMPELDGMEAAEEIRKHPELDEIPIIAISASVSKESKSDCIAAGMNDFMEKPFTMQELQYFLDTYLPAGNESAEDSEVCGEEAENEESIPQEICFPPAEQQHEIIRLTRIGDVKALKTLLEEMEKQEEKYRGFVHKTLELLKKFDLEKIIGICEGQNE